MTPSHDATLANAELEIDPVCDAASLLGRCLIDPNLHPTLRSSPSRRLPTPLPLSDRSAQTTPVLGAWLLYLALLSGCAATLSSATYDLTTTQVGTGFSLPVAVTAAPGVNNKLFVVEKETGQIRILDPVTQTIAATPFLTVSNLKLSNEQGLLGLAFHPNYATNGYFYVKCTRNPDQAQILRFHADGSPTNPTTASGETLILSYPQPNSTHNGGWIGFGPSDGKLYIATGDGGNGWGANNNAPQNMTLLLGKILRLDVNLASPYIPADNPYATHPTFRKEIWSIGLRNPWRCSFDRATGDLWIGDVGQSTKEEVSLIEAGQSNLNFGWPAWEGTTSYMPAQPLASGTVHTPPILDQIRTQSTTIIGGYVYRGSAIPTLVGSYIFSSYPSTTNQVMAVQYNTTTNTLSGPDNISTKVNPGSQITSFGEDNAGELYICAYTTGKIHKIIPAGVTIASGPTLSPTTISRPYSQTLSASGGTAPYAWSLTAGALPAGVTLSSAGVISGTPTVSGNFNFTVQATATAGGSTTKAMTLAVNAAPIITSTSPLPTATQSSAYSVALTNSGGTSPFTWSISAGALPAGITLAANGLLSGTPTTAGTANFTTQVSDSVGATATKAFALTVNSGTLAPTISNQPTSVEARVRQGGVFTYDFNATGNPAPTFSLNSPPAGMTINAASGVLTWNVSAGYALGLASVTVQAANGTLPNASLTFSIDVHDHGLSSRPAAAAYLNMPTTSAGSIPALLSDTGVFSSTASFTYAPALVPYGVNAPFWSDHAIKSRLLSVPTGSTIGYSSTGSWTFPLGTVFVKHFDIDLDEGAATNIRRLETRILVAQSSGGLYGVTYRWNGNDANRVDTAQTETLTITTPAGGTRTQTWLYPSPSDCLQCHTPTANYVLGVSTRQLNGTYGYAAGSDNQLRTLSYIGMFSSALSDSAIASSAKLSPPSDSSASLEQRARSYLDSNCSNCHQPGGAPANFDARYHTPLANQNLINGAVNDNLGIANARYIAPGDTARSLIHHRVNTTNPAIRMPPLGRYEIDQPGQALLADWINSIPDPGTVAIASSTYSQTEGNSGSTNVTVSVTRSGGTAGAISVNYATLNGTATSGSDYTAASGTLNWANNEVTTQTFSITVSGDTALESDETVIILLSNVTGGAALGNSTATLTITNDDIAPTTQTVTLREGFNGYTGMIDSYISSGSPTNTAGGAGVGITETYNASSASDSRTVLVRFPIFASEGGPVPNGAPIVSASLSLYQYSTAAVSMGAHRLVHSWAETTNSWNESSTGVAWLAAGANGSGTDYVGVADGTATSPAAVGWINIDVTSGVQAFASGSTNHGWRLKGSGAVTGQSSFRSREYSTDTTQRPVLTIVYGSGAANNAPVISQAAATTPNPVQAGSSATFTAAATDVDNDPLTYTWTFGDSTSGSGAAIAHAYAAPGTYTATVTVTDGRGGSTNSSITVNVTTPPFGTLAFSATTLTLAEGNSGSANATITVTRTGGNFGAVSVSYASANGTATAGTDYSATSGTLSWADGDTAAKPLTVTITGDTTFESDETVLLSLSTPTGGATLGTNSATLTITNDDASGSNTVTLQNGTSGYTGTMDTYISNSSPTNTGGGTSWTITATHNVVGTDTRVVLVRFPIFTAEGGPVPNGATIQSATLSLYQYSAVAHNFGAHRLLKAWSEATGSWNDAAAGTPWTTGGASGLGTDIIATADGTGATVAAVGWLHINVTPGAAAFSTGTPNHGWRLKGINAASGSENFRSREYPTDATLRPKLVIVYTVPSGPG